MDKQECKLEIAFFNIRFAAVNIEYIIINRLLFMGNLSLITIVIIAANAIISLKGFDDYQILNKGVGDKKEIKNFKYDKEKTSLASFKDYTDEVNIHYKKKIQS